MFYSLVVAIDASQASLLIKTPGAIFVNDEVEKHTIM